MVGDQARRNENNPHSVDPPHQTSDQIFKGGGGYNFSRKDKLKYGIFIDKKVYKQEFFVLL